MDYSKMTNEELIKVAREGDEYAENLLMKNNMGLIYDWVNKLKNKGIERTDLFSAGQLGLVRAYKSYNKENVTKAKFHTYAYQLIKNEMLKMFEYQGRKVRKRLENSTNSLSELLFKSGYTDCLEDVISNTESNLEFNVLYRELLRVFNYNATDQQKDVFRLSVFHGLSYSAIGKKLNISKQYVCVILNKIRKDYFSQLIEI